MYNIDNKPEWSLPALTPQSTTASITSTPTCNSGTLDPSTQKCKSSVVSTYAAGVVGEVIGTSPSSYLYFVDQYIVVGVGSQLGNPNGTRNPVPPGTLYVIAFGDGPRQGNWIRWDIMGQSATQFYDACPSKYPEAPFMCPQNNSIPVDTAVAYRLGCTGSDTLSGTTCTHTDTVYTDPTCLSGTLSNGVCTSIIVVN